MAASSRRKALLRSSVACSKKPGRAGSSRWAGACRARNRSGSPASIFAPSPGIRADGALEQARQLVLQLVAPERDDHAQRDPVRQGRVGRRARRQGEGLEPRPEGPGLVQVVEGLATAVAATGRDRPRSAWCSHCVLIAPCDQPCRNSLDGRRPSARSASCRRPACRCRCGRWCPGRHRLRRGRCGTGPCRHSRRRSRHSPGRRSAGR